MSDLIETANKYVRQESSLPSHITKQQLVIKLLEHLEICEAELAQSMSEHKEVVKQLEAADKLLDAAICPACDGSGAILREVTEAGTGCCGNILPSGECCGNAIPVPIQGFELDECQWCYEVKKLKEGEL